MKKYVYQLFHVSLRGEEGQTDVDWGPIHQPTFTS